MSIFCCSVFLSRKRLLCSLQLVRAAWRLWRCCWLTLQTERSQTTWIGCQGTLHKSVCIMILFSFLMSTIQSEVPRVMEELDTTLLGDTLCLLWCALPVLSCQVWRTPHRARRIVGLEPRVLAWEASMLPVSRSQSRPVTKSWPLTCRVPYWIVLLPCPQLTHWTHPTGELAMLAISPTPLHLWQCSHQGCSTPPCLFQTRPWYIVVCWRVVAPSLCLWPSSLT